MAGTPDRNLMSVADAKARLLEFGAHPSGLGNPLANPVVLAGAAVIVGVIVARRLVPRSRQSPPASLLSLLSQAGAVAAPLLVEQFVRGIASHRSPTPAAEARNGTVQPAGQHG